MSSVPNRHAFAHPPLRAATGVLVPLLILLCAGAARAQEGVLVTGSVHDDRTRAPIPNVAVTVVSTGRVVTTDSAGAFRLHGIGTGRHAVRVEHIAYGTHTVDLEVGREERAVFRVLLSPTAIALEPVNVNVLSTEELRARGQGFRRGVVTREQIAAWEGTHMTMPDVLQANVPTVRVRRVDRVVGAPICIELRASRVLEPGCRSPVVFLDGAPVNDPTTLYGTLNIRTIERIEVIPASEAGVRFGPRAMHGALLIETIRPGPRADERVVERAATFDWTMDQRGHATPRVALFTALGNAAGLAVGVTAARQCLHLRQPSNDGLVSDCDALPTIGLAAAALALPAIGTGIASRLAGRTERSEGRLAPAIIGAAMTLLPGYALVMTGRRNNSSGLEATGYGVLLVGTPVISTAADYLFRKLRRDNGAER